MKILAADTSSTVTSIAIIDNEKLIGEYTINHKKTHSQKLMPMMEELMNDVEIKPSDIDIYAASNGPGSFTGLRIGITCIKSIAFGVQKKVVGVPTLDALAYNISESSGLICPIMDARNSQVYTALYKNENGSLKKLTEYMGVHISELLEIISGKNQKVTFNGDGVLIHRNYLTKEFGDLCSFAQDNLMLQRASSVAYVAKRLVMEGYSENCFDMVPFYLRKSQAEREFERKSENEFDCKVKI